MPETFGESLADWSARLLAAAADGPSHAERICSLCVEMLSVTGAGISMVTPAGNRGVVCATDERAARIEDLQLILGVGPCVDAVSQGSAVLIPDLTEPGLALDRWPGFVEAAAGTGVAAVFAFPLRVGGINVGALDLYRDTPGELTDKQLSGALVAAHASALAVLRGGVAPGGPSAEGFDAPPMYQVQVHQATGMVQVQMGVTTEVALLMLRARAFAAGRPLHALATDVVERRLRFTPEDP